MSHLTKQERIQQIINSTNNFYLGLASLSLFRDRASYERLNEMWVEFGGKYEFDLKIVVNLLDDENASKYACSEFERMLLRMLLKEAFEMVQAYAQEHNLLSDFATVQKMRSH